MTRTVAALAYAEPVSSLVAAFKYRAELQHGRVLGDLLLERVRETYAGQPLPELLIPVPLHRARLRERGFNQAVVLALQLGRRLGIPVAMDTLARVLYTPAQRGLSARERKRNLRGAFVVERDLASYASIALIDDVVTTMSTMRELARVVRAAHPGQPELHAWCLARA